MGDLLECNNCGKCCIKYGGNLGSITIKELERLPEHAKQIALNGYITDNVIDLWIDMDGNDYDYCPWLFKNGDKYYCTIYEHRPDVCRDYPVCTDQMKSDECEMLVEFVRDRK